MNRILAMAFVVLSIAALARAEDSQPAPEARAQLAEGGPAVPAAQAKQVEKTAPVPAETKPALSRSALAFFQNLKASLEESSVLAERKKSRGASVAAVRGADQRSALGDPNISVLKGSARSRKRKRQAAEDAEFASAVELILDGHIDEGVKALESFEAKHPKSRQLDKVRQAIDQAKAPAAA